MKKLLKSILTVLLSALMLAMCCGVTAFAADETVPTEDWHKYLDFNKCSDFSINYNGSDKEHYAFKIDNKDYNLTSISRTYTVKPNTEYKLSAMVKCTGYKAEKSGNDFGAGILVYNIGYASTVNNSWKKLEISFNSKDNTEIYVNLLNGYTDSYCKGTAYFSDVKLEEVTKTDYSNEWNVLAIIVKDIDAPAYTLEGKKTRVKTSLSDKGVKNAKNIIKRIETTFPEWSDNGIKIKDLDIATITSTVTSLNKMTYGYSADINVPQIGKVVEKYTAKKHYNQIFVISPEINQKVNKIGGAWAGYNNTYSVYSREKYDGAYSATYYVDKNCKIPDFLESCPELGIMHEMIHSIEYRSRDINGDKTPKLDSYKSYGYGGDEKHSGAAWNKRYLQTYKKPFKKDGKYIDKQAFTVINKIEYKDVTGKLAVNETVPVGKDKNIYIK